ncbi:MULTISPECIES: discoidin domain-containing protein [unclassified Carboxylicivirga]|uniref:discoidin domain-containing protein n=1 Tax=Carboxylicivirga TaxID=1628153 RepID=UPI003D348363
MEFGQVKARSFTKDQMGSVVEQTFGIVKKDWKLLSVDHAKQNHAGILAFYGDVSTYWQSSHSQAQYLAIDLGKAEKLTGFVYTSKTRHAEGMIEEGDLKISQDGKR